MTGGLNQVERHLARLFEIQSELCSLMVSSAGDELTLLFYRSGRTHIHALILIDSDSRWEQGVRGFFDQERMAPSQSYPIPKGTGGRLGLGLVYAMPGVVVEAARITVGLLREVCPEGEDADVRFRFYRAGER